MKKLIFPLLLCLLLSACTFTVTQPLPSTIITPDQIPPYSGDPFVVLNGNTPDFAGQELSAEAYERYAPLDALGRCGVAEACIGPELMPTEERGGIGQVKPTGWHTVKYDIVGGKYLYNRCHLIGYQLTGENANEQNLITGTRYLNVEGMLPFEDMVADYIRETGNHVLYRVRPIFEGRELLARGVRMEAWSVEDKGEGICFHVYVYNVQPGISIDYTTGGSTLTPTADEPAENTEQVQTYILNVNSKKFHLPSCSGAASIKDENREEYTGDRQALIDQGYDPCKTCNP